MTREETIKAILSSNGNILLELPTSYGKSKIALDIIANKKAKKVLIVVPRLVLINNWKEEIKKWNMSLTPEFVTYVSLPKKAGNWDIVVFDECHHLSERCREALHSFTIKCSILLSATVKRDLKREFFSLFRPLSVFNINVKQATDEGILPDPQVYLIPLQLDIHNVNCSIVKNPKKGNPIIVDYKDRWKVNTKSRKVIIRCTEKQYYNDITSLIEWHKRRVGNPIHKNAFLYKSGERLKWLSDRKTKFVYELLKELKDYRTLTFCNGILQTEVLGKYCVNSKNREATSYLSMFNEGKIKHITACNMLDEGVNLVNCRVGIYASLNSSDRMIVQKLGRLLRHPNPIIIIPYYKDTRDEEIVRKMCENYNPELITVINNINDLKL